MKYVIEKGKHFTNGKFRWLLSLALGIITADTLMRGIMFRFGPRRTKWLYIDPDNWYSEDQLDKDKDGYPLTGWNKLYGFTGFFIHKYSARLCYQPDFNRKNWFRVVLYYYNNNGWEAERITYIQGGKFYKTYVQASKGYYKGSVTVNGEERYAFALVKRTPHFIGLDPYFGGQSGAATRQVLYLISPWLFKIFKEQLYRKLNIS